jgi:hypothetical protein
LTAALTRRLPRSPGARWTLGLFAAVVGWWSLTGAINALLPAPSGPSGSVYATATAGTAAYGSLLTAYGHHVAELRSPPANGSLDPRTTMFVLDPPAGLSGGDVAALRAFVRAGGRLVAGGAYPQLWLAALLHAPPSWSSRGAGDPVRVVAAAATLPGVARVATAGAGRWLDPGNSTIALAGPAGGVLALARLGRGSIALLADVSPLQNSMLASADDAQLGLDLAGPRSRVDVFVEAVHGFGGASGLGAIPSRWRWALIGLAFAALLFAAAHARRLGVPDPRGRAPAPPRALYVQALAATLSRTRSPARAAEPVRTAALEILARVAGGDAPDALRATGVRCGLTEEELVAVLDGPVGDAGVLAAGRALARLRTLRR